MRLRSLENGTGPTPLYPRAHGAPRDRNGRDDPAGPAPHADERPPVADRDRPSGNRDGGTRRLRFKERILQATICALRMPDGRAHLHPLWSMASTPIWKRPSSPCPAAAAAWRQTHPAGGCRAFMTVAPAPLDPERRPRARRRPGLTCSRRYAPAAFPASRCWPCRRTTSRRPPVALVARLRPLANHFDHRWWMSAMNDLPVAASSAEAAILVVRQDRTATTALKSMQHKLAMYPASSRARSWPTDPPEH